MGSTSSSTLHPYTCNNSDMSCISCKCFLGDKHVQHRDVVRDTSTKWIWTNKHRQILNECLTSFDDQFPLHIISLIKQHSFSTECHHYISETAVSAEKYYTKNEQLLNKTLCAQWFHKQHPFKLFSIAIIDSGAKTSRRLMDYFSKCCYYLPVLQLQARINTDTLCELENNVKRTLHIDGCRVSVNLLKTANDDNDNVHLNSVQLNLLVVDENNNIKDVDAMIKRMKARHCGPQLYILVNVTSLSQSHQMYETDQICKNYNIPCFNLSVNSDKSMHNLFIFAIKHYWFNKVQNH